MTEQSPAWLLEPLGSAPCAVAEHEIVHYLSSMPVYPVGFAPRHCESAIRWRDRLVPVMNFSPLMGEPAPVRRLAVLAYQEAAGEPLRYLALALKSPPKRIAVDDAGACELPTEYDELWSLLTKACFRHEQTPTPIIDIKRLCSAQFRDVAARRLATMPVLQPAQ